MSLSHESKFLTYLGSEVSYVGARTLVVFSFENSNKHCQSMTHTPKAAHCMIIGDELHRSNFCQTVHN